MDGLAFALVVAAVVLVMAGVAVFLRRRRVARAAATDPRAAARAAIRGLGRERRKQGKGTMRGDGTGVNSTFDSSWGAGGGGLS
ncbi:hypothetical protein [Asanoa iriomotensis]|uniref:LPXTG-motif cell wall-anchored protein n=1 Tax=Asanoa iriomotensis TaxID=234613 RepID=A0ABQ4CAR8_9ACTN|nr:hypothetical protein [Asanoa iriomotensis]GIF59849.1 hypothetical protein Air01nite_59440 [Asanoa iriomotensis]